jgi:hypothetical protein
MTPLGAAKYSPVGGAWRGRVRSSLAGEEVLGGGVPASLSRIRPEKNSSELSGR